MARKALICTFLILLSLGAHGRPQARPPEPRETGPFEVEVWTSREGLPQNEVTALVQDTAGYLWVGTFGGLVRFDGCKLEVFELASHPGLLSNRILSLFEARDGSLWIGTQDRGLVRFRNGQFSSFTEDDGLPSSTVTRCLQDAGGRIWVSTSRGLAWIDGDRVVAVEDFAEAIGGLAEAVDGSLWVADNGRVSRLADGIWSVVLSGDRFTALLAAEDGSMWVSGAHTGIQRWNDGVSQHLGRPPSGETKQLFQRRDGEVWALGGYGVARWGSDGERYPRPEFDDLLRPLRIALRDDEGSLWLGGARGLSRVRGTPMSGITLAYEAGCAPQTLLVDHEDRLWVGFYDGRIGYFPVAPQTDTPFRVVTGAGFEDGPWGDSMLLCRDGSIVVASAETIWRIREAGACVEVVENDRPEERCCALFEGEDETLWGGGDGTLFHITAGRTKTWDMTDGIPGGTVQALLETEGGKLWVGAEQGLCLLSEGRVVRTWRSEGAEQANSNGEGLGARVLPSGAVRAILPAGPGRVWVGTYGGGLCRVSEDGDVQRIGMTEGLHEAIVSRIVDDGLGNLVLQGNRALQVVARSELDAVAEGRAQRVHARVFDSGPGIDLFEGMGGAMPLECRDADDVLWFPTLEGLVRFDPAAFTRLDRAPPVLIESVVVDGRECSPGDGVRVESKQRDLSFHFAALTFVEPERAEVRYRLEGYDEDWIDAGDRREAVYSRLPPGSYRFRVAAANRDGVWNETGASIDIEIPPHFHERLWFRSVLIAAVFTALGLSFRARMHRVRVHAKKLEGMVASRTTELTEARDKLEEQVYRRTRELAKALATLRGDMHRRGELESQLRQAQKLEAVGRLAGGLAHDFNNILTAVSGEADIIVDVLEDEKSDPLEVLEAVRGIQGAVVGAATLTRQLLAYSQNQVLQPEVFDPNERLFKLGDMLRRLIREDIELVLNLDGEVGCVRVDPGQLEQVIVNLVVNARDAMGSGGRITIETTREALPEDTAGGRAAGVGAFVCIAVSDTGKGMDADTVDQLFDPFFSTKDVGRGRGLGLSSVAGIVKQSGGVIRVKSEPGCGATFEVYFPVVARPDPVVPRPPGRPDQKPANAKNVLVCDDEAGVGRVTMLLLERMGFRVSLATDPRQAIEMTSALKGGIDLLVTDLVMPGMNGRALAHEFRMKYPGLCVLFVSGYSSKVLEDGSDLEPMSAFLSKPYTKKQLEEKIADLLSSQVH